MIYVQYQKNSIADVLGKVSLVAEVFEVTFLRFFPFEILLFSLREPQGTDFLGG